MFHRGALPATVCASLGRRRATFSAPPSNAPLTSVQPCRSRHPARRAMRCEPLRAQPRRASRNPLPTRPIPRRPCQPICVSRSAIAASYPRPAPEPSCRPHHALRTPTMPSRRARMRCMRPFVQSRSYPASARLRRRSSSAERARFSASIGFQMFGSNSSEGISNCFLISVFRAFAARPSLLY